MQINYIKPQTCEIAFSPDLKSALVFSINDTVATGGKAVAVDVLFPRETSIHGEEVRAMLREFIEVAHAALNAPATPLLEIMSGAADRNTQYIVRIAEALRQQGRSITEVRLGRIITMYQKGRIEYGSLAHIEQLLTERDGEQDRLDQLELDDIERRQQ